MVLAGSQFTSWRFWYRSGTCFSVGCSHLQVFHPTAKMLVELSKSQDVEAGDGTTSVVVLCGSLLDACQRLLSKGIHATVISEAFQAAVVKAEEILTSVAIPVR